MNFLVNCLKYSLFGVSFVLLTNMPTRATEFDMSKFTCAQLLGGSPDAIDAAVWTSGYYNGMHKNTKLDLENMKHNAEVIVAACKENPTKALMQMVDEMLEAGKKK